MYLTVFVTCCLFAFCGHGDMGTGNNGGKTKHLVSVLAAESALPVQSCTIAGTPVSNIFSSRQNVS